MKIDLPTLRAYAVTRTLSQPVDLATVIETLGFVQIDPIRAPARAQDLILRHRVDGYRIGDLASQFADLPLAEDFLHVYGVLPASSLRLLHPRRRRHVWRVEREHPKLARKILDFIGRNGPAHPRELTRSLGSTRIVNGWGGSSAATTRMLEALHYRGALRVLGRDHGVKIYGLAPPFEAPLPLDERADHLLRMLVRLYAPLSASSLRQLAVMVGQDSLPEATRARAIMRLLKTDWLARGLVDGIEYFWPAGEALSKDVPTRIRLLAPFDPIVWDRRRFEHLWQWDYRFEAYTPPAKRRYGYYALPLLWRDRVIGWANVARTGTGLDVRMHFVDKQPGAARFARELDREVDGLKRSLAI
ncbi:MAG TPA: crosslink repair DNA glycosylase YcaQ family protein [Casimicrobiaceae bacterium]